MASSTEAQPEVRQAAYVPPAPERDAITEASVAAYTPENSVGLRSPGEQTGVRVADASGALANGDNPFDFSTGNIFSSVFDKGDNVQLAALRTGNEPVSDKVKPSKETGKRVDAAMVGLTQGDTSGFQQYLKDMTNATDPAQKRDLQAGMQRMSQYLGQYGVDAKVVMGELNITLPGSNGKTLTIDKDGKTNLQGNDLQDFGRKFADVFKGDDKQLTISDRMTNRLDDIENGLKRTNLSGLQGAIKEIGDKIHSIKPGAAGAAEKKDAGELQDMLDVLGSELSRDNVNARYDRDSGRFSITQPDASGKNETLTVDKFGRANMSGEQLRFFLIRLRENQEKQPTMKA